METSKTRTDILFLTVISAVVLIWNIWTGSLLSWDEGFYGGVSKEIFRTGDWINLYWSGMPWSDKPPLYMWMTNIFYNLFGINEFSVRLFSSLCGMGTVIVTYLLALKLYNRKAAIASSLVLLSTWHFVWSSKVGMLDIALTFFISLSLLLFELGTEKRKFLILSPIVFALAFLTKGPGAMIIPIIICIYALFSGKARKLIDPCFIFGALVSLLILTWWHLAVFKSYGDTFIKGYFLQHLVSRTTTALDGHTGDLFTYFGAIPNKGRPWSAVGLALIPILVFITIWKKEKQHLLPVIWACCVILIFSVVKTKLHWYIMPVYPALALMTGWAAEKIFRRYTVPVISLLFVCFLAYLAVDKNIFNLDYSPRIKSAALGVLEEVPPGKQVFLYDISDPGMQFYLGWAGQNIRGEKSLPNVLSRENVYVFVGKNNLGRLPQTGYTVVAEYPDFILIRS
jgi:4-amino-4-deoxy-L-arabinose transferase-like glycosyltransferase